MWNRTSLRVASSPNAGWIQAASTAAVCNVAFVLVILAVFLIFIFAPSKHAVEVITALTAVLFFPGAIIGFLCGMVAAGGVVHAVSAPIVATVGLVSNWSIYTLILHRVFDGRRRKASLHRAAQSDSMSR